MELNGNDVNYLNNLIKGDTLEVQPVYAETPRLTTDLSSQRKSDKLTYVKSFPNCLFETNKKSYQFDMNIQLTTFQVFPAKIDESHTIEVVRTESVKV